MKIKIFLIILILYQCKPRPIEGLVYKEDEIDSVLIDNIYPSRDAFRLNKNQSIFPGFYYMVEDPPNYVTKKIKYVVNKENNRFNIKTEQTDYALYLMPEPFVLWKKSNNDTIYTLYNDTIITKFMLNKEEFYRYQRDSTEFF